MIVGGVATPRAAATVPMKSSPSTARPPVASDQVLLYTLPIRSGQNRGSYRAADLEEIAGAKVGRGLGQVTDVTAAAF